MISVSFHCSSFLIFGLIPVSLVVCVLFNSSFSLCIHSAQFQLLLCWLVFEVFPVFFFFFLLLAIKSMPQFFLTAPIVIRMDLPLIYQQCKSSSSSSPRGIVQSRDIHMILKIKHMWYATQISPQVHKILE